KAAIVEARVLDEVDLEVDRSRNQSAASTAGKLIQFSTDITGIERRPGVRERSVLSHTIVQCAHPGFLEISPGRLLPPVSTHDVVSLLLFVAGDQREQFKRGFAVIQRFDQRLLNA